ncbi:MAG: glycosyltransferase family 4 protein [Acidobacteria bacterium]|nr:glycosyltransferase family 4 protein [Acidobacteriota bacterium]
MKVAHVSLACVDSVARLSSFATLTGLVKHLALGGHEVHVLARASRDEDGSLDGPVSVHLRSDTDAPLPGLTVLSPKLLRLARSLAPDVVHAHGLLFPTQLVAMRSVLPSPTALVVQHHGEPPPSGLRGLAARLLPTRPDAALFTATAQSAEFLAAGQLSRLTPVHAVPETGTDFTPVSPRPSLLAGSPAILWVARLHLRKDPLTALEAFRRYRESAPNAHLTLVYGEAPHEAEVNAAIERLGLAAAVTKRGRVPHEDLPGLFSSADAFLSTSPKEGCNYALVEALACGTPSVATDVEPHQTLTGGFAHLFPPGDADAAAEALARAVKTSADGRARIAAHAARALSWPSVVDRTLAIYDEAIRRRRAR